jgi:hypothetical protein
MNCTNCGAKLGCGCQKRIASDGRSCCANCISAYEAGLKKTNLSMPGTKPSNVSVFYTAPKKTN